MIFIRNSRPDTRIVRWTGFTLTELMIVVGVIGLLAVIAMPVIVKARDNSRLGVIYRNLRELDSAKEPWAVEQKKGQAEVVNDISDLADHLRCGKINNVIRENHVPIPVGTPPEAALLSGIGLGRYALRALISAS